MLSLMHFSLLYVSDACFQSSIANQHIVGLSQMLHFCDISVPLICHAQRQASGNTLTRAVFKELEHCVVLLLVFIYLLSHGGRGKSFVAF